MSHHKILDSALNKLLISLGGKRVVDVGCGLGRWGYFIRTQRKDQPIIIGVDKWNPYLDILNKMNIYDKLIHADATSLPFNDRAFDIVLAIEVIEHLPKKLGNKLIIELERICKGRLVITTPLGFFPQYDLADNPNPYDEHKSSWRPKDFARRGYFVKVEYSLPKTLYVIDRIRRILFNFPKPVTEIIAWRDFD